MTEEINNIILEHLRHIRRKVDQTAEDVLDLKMRVSSVERSTALLHLDMAQANNRLDHIDKRIDRIESRLDLTE